MIVFVCIWVALSVGQLLSVIVDDWKRTRARRRAELDIAPAVARYRRAR